MAANENHRASRAAGSTAGCGFGLCRWSCVGLESLASAAWWCVAAALLLAASAFFYRRGRWLARPLCLFALAALGALNLQLREISASHPENDERFAQITDGREVIVKGYALRDGVSRSSAFGGETQLVDVAVENDRDGNISLPLGFSIRLNVYSQEAYSEQAENSTNSSETQPFLFLYGERLRFPVKLRQPRNFGDPGAFDERGYLAQLGIAALGSARMAKVERLPGNSGSAWQRRLASVRRSLLARIHTLWKGEDGSLLCSLATVPSSTVNHAELSTHRCLSHSGGGRVEGGNICLCRNVVFTAAASQ
jgi:hypothetical protein